MQTGLFPGDRAERLRLSHSEIGTMLSNARRKFVTRKLTTLTMDCPISLSSQPGSADIESLLDGTLRGKSDARG